MFEGHAWSNSFAKSCKGPNSVQILQSLQKESCWFETGKSAFSRTPTANRFAEQRVVFADFRIGFPECEELLELSRSPGGCELRLSVRSSNPQLQGMDFRECYAQQAPAQSARPGEVFIRIVCVVQDSLHCMATCLSMACASRSLQGGPRPAKSTEQSVKRHTPNPRGLGTAKHPELD